MKTLSRTKNGAVNVGNTDLILPVRVRARTEGVDRTSEANWALEGGSQCAARNGRSEEASQRYSEGWRVGLDDVRASAPLCEALRASFPARSSGETRYGVPSPAIRVLGVVIWRQGCFIKPVKSHVVSAVCGRVNGTYKAPPKGFLMRRICEAVSGSADEWDVSRA